MNVGVVGLGLIGGSMAKAYQSAGHAVYGYDRDKTVLGFAQLDGTLAQALDTEGLAACELLIIAINPRDAVAYLEEVAPRVGKGAVVIDCCGVKRFVCSRCFPLAERHGFTFVGGHPMAGSHKAGYKNSRANFFHGAPMIVVPPVYDDASLYGRIKELLKPAGFGRLTFTTAEKHDAMIAFSSQMAHVVSNAYVKSPSARDYKGFSAGSYKDMTRVAQLDAAMWAELCVVNNEFLLGELDGLIDSLGQYRAALAGEDEGRLRELLEEGSRVKRELP
ncbi:MAG: prephenate dehydrogenase [Lachnospiraceae bacterium]|jgi:prephenate dehydrogenase|nr:prephenate dehydrogenase [Lachnospiraceae bacterium]